MDHLVTESAPPRRVSTSPYFDAFFAAVVLMNAVFIGVEASPHGAPTVQGLRKARVVTLMGTPMGARESKLFFVKSMPLRIKIQ